jgi:two-component system, NarL family, nitrate/nitrite response regulator NarL
VPKSQPLCRTIGVLVADSSPITSQLLAEAIGRHRGIEILGFGSEPEKLFDGILGRMPDVALISARLGEDPDGGFRLLQMLRVERPRLKSVMLLDSHRPESVIQAFRSGASGVFGKNMPVQMLCKCIKAVYEGQIWANSEELSYVVEALSAAPQQRRLAADTMSMLSRREQEVVQLLAEGLTNRQIADRLTISPHTVKNYLFKIFDKLGTSNRLELVFLVLGHSGETVRTNLRTGETQANDRRVANGTESKPEPLLEVPKQPAQSEHEPRRKQSSLATSLGGFA